MEEEEEKRKAEMENNDNADAAWRWMRGTWRRGERKKDGSTGLTLGRGTRESREAKRWGMGSHYEETGGIPSAWASVGGPAGNRHC